MSADPMPTRAPTHLSLLKEPAVLPPIPLSYILAFTMMLIGVLALQTRGATLIESVAAIDALVGLLVFLAWRQSR